MTNGTMAPEEATRRLESRVEALRDAALEFLRANGGSASLGELLTHLRAQNLGDELVSRALASLASSGQLAATSDRRVVLLAR